MRKTTNVLARWGHRRDQKDLMCSHGGDTGEIEKVINGTHGEDTGVIEKTHSFVTVSTINLIPSVSSPMSNEESYQPDALGVLTEGLSIIKIDIIGVV